MAANFVVKNGLKCIIITLRKLFIGRKGTHWYFKPSPAEYGYALSLQTVDPDQLASSEAN